MSEENLLIKTRYAHKRQDNVFRRNAVLGHTDFEHYANKLPGNILSRGEQLQPERNVMAGHPHM